MAGPYYCDLTADFVDRSGVDSGANVLTGPGGFQAAIRGTGLATPLAAGEILYLYGTAHLTRLVKLTCGKDVSGWTLGASVVDNDTGAHWAGKVCQLSVGGNTAIILVQLDAGSDEDDVATANGINNTTDVDTTTLSAKACEGITIDTASGSLASGFISLIGVTAAYADDGTLFTLDGDGDATQCLYVTKDYYYIKNFRLTNSAGVGFSGPGSVGQYWVMFHGKVDSHVSHGFNSRMPIPGFLFDVQISDNGGSGFSAGQVQLVGCMVCDNATHGYDCRGSYASVWSIFHDNGSDQVGGTGYGAQLIGCVVDGEDDASSGHGMYVVSGYFGYAIATRFTHNDAAGKYGISWAAASAGFYGWCGFNDNTANVNNGISFGNNELALADDGYTDRTTNDFNIKTGADLRSEAWALIS